MQAVVGDRDAALQLWQQGLLPVLISFCRQLLHGPDQTGLLDAAALGYIGPEASILSSGTAGAGAAAAAADLPQQSAVMVSTVGAYASASDGGGSDSGGGGGGGDTAVVPSPQHQQWCMLLNLWATVLIKLSQVVTVDRDALEFLTAAEPRLLLAVQLFSSSHHAATSSSSHGQTPSDTDQDSASRALVLAMTGYTPDGLLPGMGRTAAVAPVLLTLSNVKEAEYALFLLKFMVHSVGDWELQRPGSLANFRSAAASLIDFVALPTLER